MVDFTEISSFEDVQELLRQHAVEIVVACAAMGIIPLSLRLRNQKNAVPLVAGWEAGTKRGLWISI